MIQEKTKERRTKLRQFGQHMSRHNGAKHGFLRWIDQQAQERGTALEVNYENKSYYRKPDITAQLRSTTRYRRFQTRDAADELFVSREIKNQFNRQYTVILQVTDPTEFNPEIDHFYPIPVARLRPDIGSKHASGEYQLSFDLNSNKADLYRDNLQAALGLRRERNKGNIGPSGSNPLQDIAKDICDESDGEEGNQDQN